MSLFGSNTGVFIRLTHNDYAKILENGNWVVFGVYLVLGVAVPDFITLVGLM